MIAKTSTYPKGQHWKLSLDDIVQRVETIAGTKRFRDTYVHELQDGDEYWIPGLTNTRTDTMLRQHLERNCIDVVWNTDVEGNPESVELVSKWGQTLCTYPFGDNCLAEAINFDIDQREQDQGTLEMTDEEADYIVHRCERGEI